MNPIHGNLTQDPKASIERTITIFRKKIQVQHLILGTTTAAVIIGSLLLEKTQHEDATRSHSAFPAQSSAGLRELPLRDDSRTRLGVRLGLLREPILAVTSRQLSLAELEPALRESLYPESNT